MDDASRISKSRACSECKKHKIKCERRIGDSDCVRCHRQGRKCVVNSQFQSLIDHDSEWKKNSAAQIAQLQAAISDLLQKNHLPPLLQYGTTSSPQQHFDASNAGPSPDAGPTTMTMTRENSQEPDAEEPELVSAPMRSLYEVTKLRNLRSNLRSTQQPRMNIMEEDFISRGLLPLEEAEKLFSLFNNSLNHFLWGGIALVHPDLTCVRRSSSLLCAAILTVAALCIPDQKEICNACYNEFITIVSNSTLNRYHTLDEIRGLCIGAFWLSDLSWKLSGHAVRIATEMNLHQSLPRMLRGKPEQYERAQLWYLLYVCDHHFSIAYGRPPVIHDGPAITAYNSFLQYPSIVPGDIRLICQVALFITLTKGYHVFGSDNEQPLAEEDFALLRSFSIDVEQWRLLWQPRLANSPVVASYPSKGVVLHYHFAKFQLNSLSLRAISSSSHLSMDRKEAANIAISSAMATLNFVLEEPDIRGAIVGVPLFSHTMVAFCAVFLLKVAWKWTSAHLNIDPNQIQDLVQQIVELMSSAAVNEQHITYHIAAGLTKMLDRLRNWNSSQARSSEGSSSQTYSMNTPNMPQGMGFDTFSTYGFDFDSTWNEFSPGLDYFASTLPGGG